MSKNLRLGMFIVATLAVLATGIFLIGDKQLLFSSTYPLRADFDDVAGLNVGADVRVGGVRQGTVRRIDLPKHPDGKMSVYLDLKHPTRNLIKKDSVASIKTEGLLGDKFVEVSFGSKDGEAVKDGDTLQSEPPLDISDLMNTAGGVLESAEGAMQSIESISAKIDQGKGTVGALINDKKLYQEATAATAQAKAGAAAMNENMEALKHNFLLRGFYKRRGYEDSADLTKYAITALPAGEASKRFTYDAERLFDKKDTAKLRNQKMLNDAGKFLEANKFGLAVVLGSSGMAGDADKNRVLTQARAFVVREYLAQTFKLDDTRLKTIGAGEIKSSGASSKIEIIVYPPGSVPPKNRDR
jgi:phospholipid/cholesterol/gamma-HCH transport system substrate-binding protein